MKCPNYKYKTKSGHVVKGLDSTVTESPDLDSTVTPKVCTASDSALGLTKATAGLYEGFYYVHTDKQLQSICECDTIDYVNIGGGRQYPYPPPWIRIQAVLHAVRIH